jgi:hypothetical protein
MFYILFKTLIFYSGYFCKISVFDIIPTVFQFFTTNIAGYIFNISFTSVIFVSSGIVGNA